MAIILFLVLKGQEQVTTSDLDVGVPEPRGPHIWTRQICQLSVDEATLVERLTEPEGLHSSTLSRIPYLEGSFCFSVDGLCAGRNITLHMSIILLLHQNLVSLFNMQDVNIGTGKLNDTDNKMKHTFFSRTFIKPGLL